MFLEVMKLANVFAEVQFETDLLQFFPYVLETFEVVLVPKLGCFLKKHLFLKNN